MSTDTEITFLRNLKNERKRRRWSQAHMTELLRMKGVSLAATGLTKIEHGHRKVRIDEAIAIADVLGTTVDALAGRTPGPPYCLRCGLPHDGDCLRTIPERLDAAENGDQFGRVINSLFTALEHAIDEEDQ